VDEEVKMMPPTSQAAVVLTNMDVRKRLRKLLQTKFPQLAIIAYHELSPYVNIQPIGRILWN